MFSRGTDHWRTPPPSPEAGSHSSSCFKVGTPLLITMTLLVFPEHRGELEIEEPQLASQTATCGSWSTKYHPLPYSKGVPRKLWHSVCMSHDQNDELGWLLSNIRDPNYGLCGCNSIRRRVGSDLELNCLCKLPFHFQKRTGSYPANNVYKGMSFWAVRGWKFLSKPFHCR